MWERQTHRKAFWGSGKVELLSDETLACTPGEAGKTGTGGEEIALSDSQSQGA